jgi:hypothetical protein
MNSPELVPDSLLGTTSGHRTAVPLTDITQVAVRRGNWLKTAGLIFGVLVVAPLASLGVSLRIIGLRIELMPVAD